MKSNTIICAILVAFSQCQLLSAMPLAEQGNDVAANNLENINQEEAILQQSNPEVAPEVVSEATSEVASESVSGSVPESVPEAVSEADGVEEADEVQNEGILDRLHRHKHKNDDDCDGEDEDEGDEDDCDGNDEGNSNEDEEDCDGGDDHGDEDEDDCDGSSSYEVFDNEKIDQLAAEALKDLKFEAGQSVEWPDAWCEKECRETFLLYEGCKKQGELIGESCVCSAHFRYKVNKCQADGCEHYYEKSEKWQKLMEQYEEECHDKGDDFVDY